MSDINIIEFFNRIINSNEVSNEEIKVNVKKFYSFLELSKMCDNETLAKLRKIIICIDEILVLKRNIGYVDIESLVNDNKQYNLSKKSTNRHYRHYEEKYSSSCGGSTTRYTNRC
jgi:hypothetical protein